MANLNNCNFIGNVGQNPTIKSFQSGDKIATASLAVTEKYTDRSGNRQESTEWINLVFNGALVNVVENHVKTGTQLYVSGKLTTRKYTNAEGVEKTVTEIRVRDMVLLGGPKNAAAPAQASAPAAPAAPAASAAPAAPAEGSDDLPF